MNPFNLCRNDSIYYVINQFIDQLLNCPAKHLRLLWLKAGSEVDQAGQILSVVLRIRQEELRLLNDVLRSQSSLAASL